MGIKPSPATKAVISTGRNRADAPSIMAVTKSPLFILNALMNVSMTTPFNTAMPDSAMNPIAAEIDKGMPRTHRANTPPVKASGTHVRIMSASRISQ